MNEHTQITSRLGSLVRTQPRHEGRDVCRVPRPGRVAFRPTSLICLRAFGLLVFALVVAATTAAAGGEALGRVRPALTPNDPKFTEQWELKDYGIRAPAAWDRSTGSGVVIAIIGSGIQPNPDMDANVLPGYDFISDPAAALDGDGRDADPADAYATAQATGPCANSGLYGLYLASVVSALGNNGLGGVGAAFGARIVPVRAQRSLYCDGDPADVADAIRWAAGANVQGIADNANPAEVILVPTALELACSATMQSAIDTAVGHGAVVVVSAGESHAPIERYSPAGCEHVVAVAGSGYQGDPSYYHHNFGEALDLFAPFAGTGPYAEQFGRAEGFVGFSAGHVAAIAAMMQSVDPRSPAQVEAILKGTAREMPWANEGMDRMGEGLATAPAALAALETPTLFVLAGPHRPVEGNSGTRAVQVDVYLSRPATGPVDFELVTTDASASAGSDYTALAPGVHVMPAGTTHQVFTVPIQGDTVVEDDEAFQVELRNVVGAVAGKSQARVTIVTDDARPLANGVAANVSLADRVGRLYYIDVPDGAGNLTFRIGVPSGGAYWVKRGSPPTFAQDGLACQSYPYIPECRVPAAVGGRYYLRVFGDDAFSSTISASFAPPASLSINDVTIVEADAGTKALSFFLDLSRTSELPIEVDLRTVAGSASAPSDFVARDTTVTIPANTKRALFSVATVGDEVLELRESFTVSLLAARHATIADGEGIGWIIDNDGPLLSVNDIAIAEGNAGTRQMTFTVRLDRPAGVPVSYDFATTDATALAGSDYDAIAATGQVIPAGQLARTQTVTIRGDTIAEDTELLQVSVRNPVGAQVLDGQGIGYLLDDDGPALSILDASVVEGGRGASRTIVLPVRLSKPSTQDVSFQLHAVGGTGVAGSDYRLFAPDWLGIPAGQTGVDLRVMSAIGDGDIEANETIELRLDNVTGASRYDWLSTATVVNDDGPTLSVQNTSITEGNSGTKVATFLVTLSTAAAVPVTYSIATTNGTALAGSDYVGKSLAGETIPPGMLSRTFEVTINGDTLVEGTETFSATISTASGATIFRPTAPATILDND